VPADEAQATVRAAIALLASPPVVAAEIEQVRAALAQLRAHIAAVREQMPRGDSCWACRAALAATPGELAAAVHPALIDDVPLATPPAPQRFWRVYTSLRGSQAVMVDARGEFAAKYSLGPVREEPNHRAEAEADGAASGLPKWEGKS
jgi:bacterioferritin-associated ferredoxin